jgi:protein-S-isoprenylcysteine O-methyltransferase Ste14
MNGTITTRMFAEVQDRAAQIRAIALYVPIALCVVAYLSRRARIRTLASPLLSLLWTLPALLILQRFNLRSEWWSFDEHTPCLLGMPVALYLGWAIFWGLLPQLAWPKLDVLSIAIVAYSFDVLVMMFLSPALQISPHASGVLPVPAWLVGEALGIALVLVPAMLLFRWTEDKTHLGLRAGGQVLLSGLVFLYLVPELVFVLRPGTLAWRPFFAMPRFRLQLWLQLLTLLAVPGLSAVQEFATRGRGTPLPYDPPQKLVTTGVYRYCTNPMQFSCTVVMLAEAVMLRNAWLVAAAGMAALYSMGLAQWDERIDLERRFDRKSSDGDSDGQALCWTTYRLAVPAWRFRWRPFADGPPSTLYIAATCPVCSGLRAFLLQRVPVGLTLLDAETLPVGSIRRLRYVPADGASESGVLAFARALEHLNLGWAFCGFVLRLPVVHQAAQLLTDVAGFGPRTLPALCEVSVEPTAVTHAPHNKIKSAGSLRSSG